MKKQITFLVAILATTFMVAQVPTIDFEGTGIYIDGGLIDNDCSTPRAVIIDDPAGTNGKVAQLNTPAEAYHSYSIKISHNIDFSDAAKKVISLDFYQSAEDAAVRTILVKVGGNAAAEFADSATDLTGDDPAVDNWGAYEEQAVTTADAGWQTLTFDFSDANPSYPNDSAPTENISGSYSTLDVFIDFNAAIASTTAIDNIGGGTQGAEVPTDPDTWPSTAAPTPDAAAEKVKSLFSDVYTPVISNMANHGWGQATVLSTIEIVPCDFVHKNKNFQYTPYSVADYTTYDVSDMTHVRFDYWTETAFNGIAKIEAGGQAATPAVAFQGDSQWHTVEIALSDYTALNPALDFGLMNHLIIENTDFGTVQPIIYFDNVYFVNNAVGTMTEVSFEVDANKTDFDLSTGTLSIVADTAGDNSYATPITLNDDNNDGIYTGMAEVDYAVSPNFDFVVSFEDSEFNTHWSNRSAACDDTLTEDTAFNAVIDGKPNHLEKIQLLNLDPTAGTAFACYSADAYVSTPQVTSDSPSDIAGDVMSLYSDYYAPARGAVNNFEVIGWDAVWGPAETGEVDMNGNMVRYYTSSYTGIDVQPADLSTYDMMHIDLWSQNGGTFNLKIVDFGGDGYAGANPDTSGEIEFTHEVSAWKSVDIALADFMDATKTVGGVVLGAMDDINQFVVSGPQTTYLDNLYFYQSDALSTAELNELGVKAYPNPTRNNWMINASSLINSIEVYNVLGKQVMSLEANSNRVVLSGTALNNGIYFARVNAEKGSKTLKLVKN